MLAIEGYTDIEWAQVKHVIASVIGKYPPGPSLKAAAIPLLEAAMQRAPEQWAYWYGLGDYYQEVGSLRSSLTACENCYRLRPRDPRSVYALATAYRMLAQEPEGSSRGAARKAYDLFVELLGIDSVPHSARQQVRRHLNALVTRYPELANQATLPTPEHNGRRKRAEGNQMQSSEPAWVGLCGATGGCLIVLSSLSFFLCLAAFGLGSIVRYDEGMTPIPLFPYAIPAFYALAVTAILTAIMGGTALGVRAFSQKSASTLEALRATFTSALLPLRYVIGALQAVAGIAIFLLLFFPVVGVGWAVGALVVLSLLQGLLLIVIRVLRGPGTLHALSRSEGSGGV